MRKKLTEQEKAYRVRLANNKRLAKKALLDKPKWKPPKGKKYLKNVKIGSIVRISNQTAVLLEKNDATCKVLVIEATIDDDSDYYLGKRQWANQTCVEVIKDE